MKRLLLILVAALALAACGGTKTVTVTAPATAPATPSVPAAAAPALQCPPGDLIMQCVLATQPAPPRSFKLGSNPNVQYGIDFGWTQFSPAFLRSIGATFAISYISHDPSKDWQTGNVLTLHKAGIGLVDVFETTATRAAGGPINAAIDGPYAASHAAGHGNFYGPIIYAIDFDATGPQVAGYFGELHKLQPTRDEAYGGYNPLKYLCEHHLVGHENFQTYAWSGGRWLPPSCAPLEQYLNGNAYDHDKAIAAAYGQYFPRPNTDPYAVFDPTVRRFLVKAYSPVWGARHVVKAQERNTMRTWGSHSCLNPVKRPVCKSSRTHMVLLYGRIVRVAYSKPRARRWADRRGIRRKFIYAQLHQR